MEEIKKLTEAVQRMEAQQTEMSHVLSGNKKYGIPGMRDELQEIKAKLVALEEKGKGEVRRLFKWIAIAAVSSSMITIAALKLGLAKLAMILIKLFGL